MKKFLSLALVACALAFTSCEPKIDSPIVGSWNARGTLAIVNPSTGTTQYYDVLRMFYFSDNGTFQYNDYLYNDAGIATSDGYILQGSWSVDGDKLTLNTKKSGTVSSNNITYDSDFKPVSELIKWHIDGHYLHLTRNYGTDKEREEAFYDGSY